MFSVSCESNPNTAKDCKVDAFLYFFIIVLVSLQKLIGNLFFVGFHTHTGLKKLSKGLYNSQTQIVPHQKKSKRISLKA